MKFVLGSVACVLICVLGLFFFSMHYFPNFEISFDEVSRIRNPKYPVEAILCETNGGATTSFGYHIFILKENEKPKLNFENAVLYGAIRNERAYGVNLKWDTPESLSIEYLSAKWKRSASSPIQINGNKFQILFKQGVRDDLASPGGMLKGI